MKVVWDLGLTNLVMQNSACLFKNWIAKWLVALPHGLLKTSGGGAALKFVPFFSVTRDTVENCSEKLRLI